MKHEVLALFLVAACVAPDDGTEDTSRVTQLGRGDATGKCSPNICGLNAGELTNGGFFHELNLDGEANAEGYELMYLVKGNYRYTPKVQNGKLTAVLQPNQLVPVNVILPASLSGSQLVNSYLRLRKVVDDVASYRRIVIEQVASSTNYWAKPIGVPPPPPIETYKLFFMNEGGAIPGIGAYLCQDGASFVNPAEPVVPMLSHHALLFEGDRINVENLSYGANDPRWFNIGCAETALAKLQLNGHTQAAQAWGFSNGKVQRQTFLKMVTADYCGTGNSFTVNGTPLRWSDAPGTMTIAPTVHKVLEARWTMYGASCINTPRVEMHPSDASEEVFELGVWNEINEECGYKPPCSSIPPIPPPYLQSWNPLTVIPL